jgi:hypothetical protein
MEKNQEETKESTSGQNLMKAAEVAPLLNEPKSQEVLPIKKFVLKRKTKTTLPPPQTENTEAKIEDAKKEEIKKQETKRSKIESDETMEAIINAGISASITKAESIEVPITPINDSKETVTKGEGSDTLVQKNAEEVKKDELSKDANVKEGKAIEDVKEHLDVEMAEKDLGKAIEETQDLNKPKVNGIKDEVKAEEVVSDEKELSKNVKQEESKLPENIMKNPEQSNVTNNQDIIPTTDLKSTSQRESIEETKQETTVDADNKLSMEVNKGDTNIIEEPMKDNTKIQENKEQIEGSTMKVKEETNKQPEADQSKAVEEVKVAQKKKKIKLTDIVAEFEEFLNENTLNKEYLEKYETTNDFDVIMDVSSLCKVENTFRSHSQSITRLV